MRRNIPSTCSGKLQSMLNLQNSWADSQYSAANLRDAALECGTLPVTKVTFYSQLCVLIMLLTAEAAINTNNKAKSRSIRYFAN
jgi:hypothetical protein